MEDLVSLRNISRKNIDSIFNIVNENNFENLKNKTLGTAFFQPSTRTRLSFEVAMLELGGKVVGFSDMRSSRCFDNYFEETLEDFTRVIAEMVDLLVIRHHENNIPFQISNIVNIPIINAGDGTNEHPTQALQDIWLMSKKTDSLEGKVFGFLGNISRNHRSIVFGLKHFNISKLIFTLPPDTALPDDIKTFLVDEKIPYELCYSIADLLANADFINSFTPSMRELENKNNKSSNYIHVLDDYIINKELYEKTGSHAYILNAGPRTYEVATDMDYHPKFLFFEQVKTGILMRKGIISFLIKQSKSLPESENTLKESIALAI